MIYTLFLLYILIEIFIAPRALLRWSTRRDRTQTTCRYGFVDDRLYKIGWEMKRGMLAEWDSPSTGSFLFPLPFSNDTSFHMYSTARSNVRAICERLIDEICFTVLLPFLTLFLVFMSFQFLLCLLAICYLFRFAFLDHSTIDAKKISFVKSMLKGIFHSILIYAWSRWRKSDCCWLHNNLKVTWLLNLSRHHKSHHWFVNARNELNNLFDCIAEYWNKKKA